jgi:hypothetical protein
MVKEHWTATEPRWSRIFRKVEEEYEGFAGELSGAKPVIL